MASSTSRKSSAERVRDYRERKRKLGLKLVQFWLPDVNSPEFKAEAHRQSLAVANTPHAKDDQEFINSITIKWWEDE
jgi:hypothetical protein